VVQSACLDQIAGADDSAGAVLIVVKIDTTFSFFKFRLLIEVVDSIPLSLTQPIDTNLKFTNVTTVFQSIKLVTDLFPKFILNL